jgi:hypothetical protein
MLMKLTPDHQMFSANFQIINLTYLYLRRYSRYKSRNAGPNALSGRVANSD